MFQRSGASWNQLHKFSPVDPFNGQGFGFYVSLNDTADEMVIGSPYDNDNGTWSGSAYVFTKNAGLWGFTTKLLASDGSAGDTFGNVIISDNVIVVGSSGTNSDTGNVYVFRRNNSSWIESYKLAASDSKNYDYFGSSLDYSNGYAIIGASGHGIGGSAYVFKINETGYRQEAKLEASDAMEDDLFGRCGIFGNDIIIGARRDDDAGTDSGSVYFFSKQ